MFPEWPELMLFVAAGFALNITPGPDMLYVLGRSTTGGRSAGIAAALGIGAGTLLHIALVAFGLASLLQTVPAADTAVRVGGGVYLGYLGVRTIMGAGRYGSDDGQLAGTQRAAFAQGAVTNMLNPKVALFFLAFLPQFVDPTRGSTALQVISLGLLFDVMGTCVNLAVALAASSLSKQLRSRLGTRTVLDRLCGALFVGLGARLAFSRN